MHTLSSLFYNYDRSWLKWLILLYIIYTAEMISLFQWSLWICYTAELWIHTFTIGLMTYLYEFHVYVSLTRKKCTDYFLPNLYNERNFIVGKIYVLEYGLASSYPLQLPNNYHQTMVQNNIKCAVLYLQMYVIWNPMCLCAWHKSISNSSCAPNKRSVCHVKHVAIYWAEIPCPNFQFHQ